MKILKCTKCGSSKLVLKHVNDEERQPTALDTVFFISLGVVTFGLYFLFHHFSEVKKADLGTSYYECENCHFKLNAKQVEYEIIPEKKKEEIDEEEKEEIREIGRKPVDMTTWKKEREDAVIKRREKKTKR